MQGVKEAREKAERQEQVIRRYEAQQAERLAAAEAEKRLRAARVRADIEQACLDAWQSIAADMAEPFPVQQKRTMLQHSNSAAVRMQEPKDCACVCVW